MLSLQLRIDTAIPLEAPGITPNALQGLSLAAIAQVPVQRGNEAIPLGEAFAITGAAADGCIEIHGDCRRVKWLGHQMTSGELTIHGPSGMHTGSQMRGGTLTIHGDADHFLGIEMSGGTIRVHGNAGDQTGGAYPGSVRGMKGGTIIVHGNAGNETGHHLRRGLIAVTGQCGEFTGQAMIAGTIVALGGLGAFPGAGMKRGTIIAPGPPKLAPSFRYDCTYHPVFLALVYRELASRGLSVPQGLAKCAYQRYSGDLLELGLGELLFATP